MPLSPFSFNSDRASLVPYNYQAKVIEELKRRVPDGGFFLVEAATGSGKTFIANSVVDYLVTSQGYRVLWLAMSWFLLEQAAGDLCQRYAWAGSSVGKVGIGLNQLPPNVNAKVVYTTLGTWESRQCTDFSGALFDVIVIDEVHWGEGKQIQRHIERRYEGSKFIGLTATPHENTNYVSVESGLDFPSLVSMGVLSKPIVRESRHTNVDWSPELSAGDVSLQSLKQLAKNKERNRFIVDTYESNHLEFGKTVIFACNIGHAVTLTQMLQDKGFVAEVIHSSMHSSDHEAVMERFKTHPGATRSQIDILVNVRVFIHGFDVPDIKTVFLTRPTMSKKLFMQMVGRGARRIAGQKNSFYVVDFIDNIKKHGELLISASKEFGHFLATDNVHYLREPQRDHHEFTPSPILKYPGRPSYEAISGLEYHSGQTYGIEFEITRPDFAGAIPHDWHDTAHALLSALRAELGPEYVSTTPRCTWPSNADHRYWNVVWDGSCGWEVTTRILRGSKGLEEVYDACRAIRSVAQTLGLHVNRETGTHIHLASDMDPSKLSTLLQTVAYYEPALMSLVAPSRAHNRYCKPIRKLARELREGGDGVLCDYVDDRYWAVNVYDTLQGGDTIEIRSHSGTLNGKKILVWLSLWMRILDLVRKGYTPPSIVGSSFPLCEGEQGDILALADMIPLGPEMRRYLEIRRSTVVRNSWLQSRRYGQQANRAIAYWERVSEVAATG